jgi:hypothetical protein
VRAHFRTIPVLDQNGDQISLYEFRAPVFLGLFVRKRFKLCTGEAVRKNGKHYIVVPTGERLTRTRT